MRALIAGGGIGGLAAAIALQRVGIEAALFEKAPQITEIGAGLSLWSNAMIALRRLGLETAALKAGAVIDRTRSYLSTGEPLGSVDFAALGEKVGAPSICLYRATLQRLLLDTALNHDPGSVQTGRECTGFEAAMTRSGKLNHARERVEGIGYATEAADRAGKAPLLNVARRSISAVSGSAG